MNLYSTIYSLLLLRMELLSFSKIEIEVVMLGCRVWSIQILILKGYVL